MKKQAFLIVFLLAATLLTLFVLKRPHRSQQLPIYYSEGVKKTMVEGKKRIDSVYHTIPAFRFINQNGDTVTEKNFNDKIFVADFFFSTCPSICPKMMRQMNRIDSAAKNKNDLMLLSHSVNPEHDSVPVLAAYAKRYHADAKRWMLVTGNKKEIYDIAMDGYKLPLSEDPREPGGFLHSGLFVLIDKEKRVRGYYDGTDSTEVNKLINDLSILSDEYKKATSNTK